jgi:hypothetical protein
MGAGWQTVAFPVILPWREEFWTLPLYFPDLKVGVVPGWPPQLPYQGLPLPPEAQAPPQELRHYTPGDLRQWQAFEDYQQAQGEESDLLQALRSYGQEPTLTPAKEASPQAWSLAWQLEKMQADQEAQMLLVDRGQQWLGEILAPEPWEDKTTFGPVPGVGEMVDRELARLRYHLWLRVMALYLQDPWVPLLLGRTSCPLFLTLRGWPQWTELKKVQVSLPGCRSEAELAAVQAGEVKPPWSEKFAELMGALLEVAAASQDLRSSAETLQEFVDQTISPPWPFPQTWKWDLEIWTPDAVKDEGPVLCWSGAGVGILPG